MANAQSVEEEVLTPKPLVWLHGQIKTPPFTAKGRQEAGMLLRLLQQGEQLVMPQAEPLPVVWVIAAVYYEFAMRNSTGELCTASTPMPS